MRIFAICAAFLYSTLFAAGERAVLSIFTVPDSASVFLDGNPEKEIQRTPFENSAMLEGEHFVVIVPQSESFVPTILAFMRIFLLAKKQKKTVIKLELFGM
jgi:hypothetical protein